MKKSIGAKPLALPAPVWVIGSYSANDEPNMMVISWGGICCSNPPCVAISVKKSRKTHENIAFSRAFTVNIPSMLYMVETDYLGIVSGRDADKFAVSGLTPVRSELVDAPYVREFPVNMECMLLHTLDIGSHTQYIGRIEDIKADEYVLDEHNQPVAKEVNPLIASSSDRAYYELGKYLDQAYIPGMILFEDE